MHNESHIVGIADWWIWFRKNVAATSDDLCALDTVQAFYKLSLQRSVNNNIQDSAESYMLTAM